MKTTTEVVEHPTQRSEASRVTPDAHTVVVDTSAASASSADAAWETEMHLRHTRNILIKQQLQKGQGVQYRSSGWSLWPKVHSGDLCLYEPVLDPDKLKLDDVVFCEVQPGNRFFAHLVSDITWSRGVRYFTISNIKGKENGWCRDEHIYGRLIQVIH